MTDKTSITETQLTQLIENIKPHPTQRFYKRLDHAAWRTQPKLNPFALKAAVIFTAILTVMLLSPATNPLFETTFTPTASSTSLSITTAGIAPSSSTPDQLYLPESTPVPPPQG